MLNKILIALGALLAVVVAAILIGPSFVDWNGYKREIAEAVERTTGRRLEIAGDISVSVLPTPTLAVEAVRFANMPGASAPDMATLDALKVRIAFWPLLQGEIQVEDIALINPVILLETTADDRNNWAFGEEQATPAEPQATNPAATPDIRFDNISIENGTLIYRDAASTEHRIERLDAEISAESLRGPFQAAGSAVVGGRPAAFDISTGRLVEGQTSPLGLGLRLTETDAALRFVGSLLLQAEDSRIRGRLEGSAPDVGKLFATLSETDGGSGFAAGHDLAFKGNLDALATAVTLTDLSFRLGATTGSASATVTPGAPLRAEATLAINHLDLDPLLKSAAVEPAGPAADAAGESTPFALPEGIDAEIEATVAALTYQDELVSNLRLAATLSDGTLDLSQLTALLPGGSDVSVTGALAAVDGVPRFTGGLDANSDNFRNLLDWLAVELPDVPSERLRRMSLVSRVTATPATVEIADIDLRLDASRVRGGIVIALPSQPTAKPGFGIGLAIDQINLDAYMPGAAVDAQPDGPSQAGSPLDGLLGSLTPLADLAANLDLRIGSLAYNRQTIEGIHLDGTLQGGTLTLREFRVKRFAGGGGTLSGTVTDLAGTPSFDTQFDLAAQDAERVLQLAGLTNPAPGQLGALALGGTLSGGIDAIAYDLAFSVGGVGATGQAKGTLAGLAGGLPRIETRFDVAAQIPGPLLDAVGLPADASRELGALSIAGTANTDAGTLSYDISVTAEGIGGSGQLAGTIADLIATPQVDTRLSIKAEEPGPLLALAGLGSPTAADLGALAVDGTLAGGAGDMTVDLTVSGLAGEAGVAGTVSALSAPVEFDVALEVRHPDAGQLLASLLPNADPPAEPVGALALVAKARGTGEAFALSDLSFQAGPSKLAGTIQVDRTGERPRIDADLAGQEVAFGWLPTGGGDDAPSGDGNGSGGGGPSGRWSEEPLDLSALQSLDGALTLTADALLLGDTRVAQSRVGLTLQDGVLEVKQLTGEVHGGSIEATGRLASQGVPSVEGRLTAESVNIEQMAQSGFLARQVRGPISLNADLSSTGASVADMIGALEGSGDLQGQITILRPAEQQVGSALLGILGAQVGGIRGVTDRIDALYGAFTGEPNRLGGSFRIEEGVLRTEDTVLTGTDAHADVAGSADLEAWQLDMLAKIYRQQETEHPFLTVKLQGALDEPNVSLGGAAFSRGATSDGAASGRSAPAGALDDLLQKVVPGLTDDAPAARDPAGEDPVGQEPAEGTEPDATAPSAQSAAEPATPEDRLKALLPQILERLE